MSEIITTIEVRKTTNYEIFKRLLGNREVKEERVKIIIDSIRSIGYISNPIIVNQKMEVIDGQGRLEALKQLDMPVEYRIISDIGVEECIAMNLKPTSWTLDDFVKSYADQGNENYKRIVELHDRYCLGYSIIYSVIVNKPARGGVNIALRNGSLKLSQDEADKVGKTLEYLTRFKDVQKRIGGRKDAFYSLVAWISNLPGIDRERLCISMHQQANKIYPVARNIDTLRQITEVYNYGYSKKNRRVFDYEWQVQNVEEGELDE